MQMKKKVMSVVIALCLVLGSAAALPQNAFVDSTSITANAINTETSGKCGENINWSLNDGVLNISGSGKMTDYDSGKSPFCFRTDIKSVVIASGVTSIGKFAFQDCTKISSVTISSSVKSISTSAFYGCSGLTSVTIPSSVTSIGACAFWGCESLTSITIPNSVTSLGNAVFEECSNLVRVTLPNNITSIDPSMFSGCKSLTSISIPNGVTTIGHYVFRGCSSLASLRITSNVKNIGEKAFDLCNNLTIKCTANSLAMEYAEKNNIHYEIIAAPVRLAGAGRFETAVEISKAGFETADTVVLAYGMNYADALAGVSLAKAMNAPILLTNLKELPAETLAEIKRLKATNVVILGGTGAVSTEVEKALTDNKLNVERIAGTSRFETATKIAEKMQKLNDDKAPEDVFFVYYNGFADALSVSTVAAAKGAPVIYLQTTGDIDAETAAYLAKIKGKVKNAYVIGGTGVISDDMMNKAGTALGLTPKRVFGADRFATCVAVNEKFADVLNGKSICVATGMDFPDALAGGVFAAINNAPLFLVNGKENPLKLSDSQKSYLGPKEPQNLYVFGGTGVVSDSHVQIVADACGVYSSELLDTDKDGLLDIYEEMLGSDKNVSDTDKDGLTDYEEVYLTSTDPTKFDSVTDGVSDADIDNDNDGLTNKKEIELKTEPNSDDTDGDKLKDGDEVNKYKTDPTKIDTDGDELDDDDELKFGFDPNKQDTNGNGIIDSKEKNQQTFDVVPDNKEQAVTKVSLSMSATGNLEKTTTIESIMDKDVLCSSVVGLVGEPFSIESKSSFDKATITFTVDKTKLGETKFEDLMFLWYDKENDNFVELETSHDAANSTVSTETTHFSEYMIVDGSVWRAAWANINKLSGTYNSIKFKSNQGNTVLPSFFETPKQKTVTVYVTCCDDANDPFDIKVDENGTEYTNYRSLIGDMLIKSMREPKGDTNASSGCRQTVSYNEHDDYITLGNINYLRSPTSVLRIDLVRMMNYHYFTKYAYYLNTYAKDFYRSNLKRQAAWNNQLFNYDSFWDNMRRHYQAKTRVVYLVDRDITKLCDLDLSIKRSGVDDFFRKDEGDTAYTPIEEFPDEDKMIYLFAGSKNNRKDLTVDFLCIGDFDKTNLKTIAESANGSVYDLEKISTDDCFRFLNQNPDEEGANIDKDEDKDGLPDIVEKNGIPLSDGRIMFTDPTDPDMDKDGLKDGEELVPFAGTTEAEYGWIYTMKSDPKYHDTDYDGIADPEDTNRRFTRSFGTLDMNHDGDSVKSEVEYSFCLKDFFKSNLKYNSDLSTFSVLMSAVEYIKSYIIEKDTNTKRTAAQMLEHHGFKKEDIRLYKLHEGVFKLDASGNEEKTTDISVPIYPGDVDKDKDDLDHHMTEVCVGHQKVTYNGQTKDIVAVIVQGTNGTITEWTSNMDLGSTDELDRYLEYKKTGDTSNFDYTLDYLYNNNRNEFNAYEDWKTKENHKGFDIATNRVLQFVNEYTDKFVDKEHAAYWITGHSRGGAIANLLSANLIDHGKEVYAYTFAAPNSTTNSRFDNLTYSCIFNIINGDDFVPTLPCDAWGFNKFGRIIERKVSNYKAEWNEMMAFNVLNHLEKGEYYYYKYDPDLYNTVYKLANLVDNRNQCYVMRRESTSNWYIPIYLSNVQPYYKAKKTQDGYDIDESPESFFQVIASVMAEKTNSTLYFATFFTLDGYRSAALSLFSAKTDWWPFNNGLACPHFLQSYYLLTKKISY